MNVRIIIVVVAGIEVVVYMLYIFGYVVVGSITAKNFEGQNNTRFFFLSFLLGIYFFVVFGTLHYIIYALFSNKNRSSCTGALEGGFGVTKA